MRETKSIEELIGAVDALIADLAELVREQRNWNEFHPQAPPLECERLEQALYAARRQRQELQRVQREGGLIDGRWARAIIATLTATTA